jgi:hypothetical protein
MQSQKVILEQRKSAQVNATSPVYVVKRLVNRLDPKVGDFLSEKQVKDLMAENCGSRKVTVEVVGGKEP